jgi:hypothetical protein
MPERRIAMMARTLFPIVAAALTVFAAAGDVARGQGTIRINEVMASNDTRVADPQGEYDDWIELYNSGT